MPKQKSLDTMTLEELDQEFAKVEKAWAEAGEYKREIAAARQAVLLRDRASSVLEGMDDASKAALLRELQAGTSVVAATNLLQVETKGERD